MKTFKKNNVLKTLFIVVLIGSTFNFSSCIKAPCADVTCQNGGTSDSSDNCACNCPTGFEGQFCEEKILFQGPRNPSFEVASSNNNAANWGSAFVRKSGTGFLPSHGVYYSEINNYTNAATSASFSQEGVDLSRSSTMTFDYTFTREGEKNAICTFQVLFTSTGTTTLFEQTIDSNSTLPIQILNKKITLPKTTIPGRLMFKISVSTGSGNIPKVILGIDNIRVN